MADIGNVQESRPLDRVVHDVPYYYPNPKHAVPKIAFVPLWDIVV